MIIKPNTLTLIEMLPNELYVPFPLVELIAGYLNRKESCAPDEVISRPLSFDQRMLDNRSQILNYKSKKDIIRRGLFYDLISNNLESVEKKDLLEYMITGISENKNNCYCETNKKYKHCHADEDLEIHLSLFYELNRVIEKMQYQDKMASQRN